jgi:hypothetical protein
MSLIRNSASVGGVIALAAAGLAFAHALLPAQADDEPVSALLGTTPQEIWGGSQPIDAERLVRWDFVIDPSVSSEPIGVSEVIKIGFGRKESVRIVETSTGIYSTDAMDDPHVLYPGIERVPRAVASAEAPLAIFSANRWVAVAPLGAGSFVSISRFPGGALVTTPDGNCAIVDNSAFC